jgi:exopolysaccharide production protein ExoF
MARLHTILVSSTLVLLSSTAWGETSDYRLGPADQLEVRVSDLRSGTGEAYQWTAFNGTFTVGASGKVALPLLGELQAVDKTTAELADTIGSELQTKVGLAKRPDASIQVTKYRPIFVTGGVQLPGAYEFRPDLTVVQAVSLAGGVAKVTSDVLLTFARDAVATRGDLRLAAADRIAFLARQSRLDAEIKGADIIVLSPEVQALMGQSDVARLVHEEQLLFESRRSSLQAQIDALEESKVSLQKQIETLNAKETSLAHQVAINQKELDQVSTLVNKGMAVLPQQLAIEQNKAQFESEVLDTQTARLRAQQDLSKAERDILDLKNNRRNDTLQEATEIRNKLAETNEKLATAQNLIYQAEVRAPSAVSAAAGAVTTPVYFLTHRMGGKVETQPAQENDPVQPGDVVKVEPRLGDSSASGSVSSATVN